MGKIDEHRVQTLALRQYLHNDGSGFVFGYDTELIDAVLRQLQDENEELRRTIQIDQANKNRREYIVKMKAEIEELRAQVERMEKSEERCKAIARYTEAKNFDAVEAVITEICLAARAK